MPLNTVVTDSNVSELLSDVNTNEDKSSEVTYIMTDEYGHPMYGFPVD